MVRECQINTLYQNSDSNILSKYNVRKGEHGQRISLLIKYNKEVKCTNRVSIILIIRCTRGASREYYKNMND